MTKILQLFCVYVILIFFFSACTIEKRRYSSGYNVEWYKSKSEIKRNEFIQNRKHIETVKTATPETIDLKPHERLTVSAGISKENFLIPTAPIKENKHFKSTFPGECDIITLKNGDEIKAKVTEISKDLIKYKECDDLNGQTYTFKKSEVFMIKYPNGTKDVITAEEKVETKNESIQNKGSAIFGILSFASFVTFWALIYIAGPASLIFLLTSIVFGAIGSSKKRKLRGLAIAGLTLGIFVVLFSIIWLLSYSMSAH